MANAKTALFRNVSEKISPFIYWEKSKLLTITNNSFVLHFICLKKLSPLKLCEKLAPRLAWDLI